MERFIDVIVGANPLWEDSGKIDMGKDERNRRRVEEAWLKREAERRRKAQAAPGEPAPGAKTPAKDSEIAAGESGGPGTQALMGKTTPPAFR